jgi:hypothetical protein
VSNPVESTFLADAAAVTLTESHHIE